jgi:hypothetical protein
MAQYRDYRLGEDGLLGWTDRECRLCYSTSLWNDNDSHLKERLFGLPNPEGSKLHSPSEKTSMISRQAIVFSSFIGAQSKLTRARWEGVSLEEIQF